MNPEFPWYKVLIASAIAMCVTALAVALSPPSSIRSAAGSFSVLLYGVMMVSVLLHNRQEIAQRQKEINQVLTFFRTRQAEIDAEILEQLGQPESGRSIGDTQCGYNAISPQLRCTVNPSGPCEGCPHWEQKLKSE